MSDDQKPLEVLERETLERLLNEHASKSTTVDGTSTTKTNVSIDQAVKGFEYMRKQQASNPFAQIGLAKVVSPSAVD